MPARSTSPGLQDLARTVRQHRLGDLLRRSALRHPHKLALICGPLRQSFAGLDDTVNRTANALAARGVARGERIAIFSRNHYAFVVLRFALARLGAVMVPINFMLNASEVAYLLGHAGVRGLVAQDSLVEVAEAAVAIAGPALKLRGVIADAPQDLPPGWEQVRDWMQHDDDTEPDVDVGDDDPVQLLYTSGTESRPKGAMLSARCLYAHYTSCIVDGRMSAADIELHAMPLYHCAQLDCFLTPDLYLGATSIVLPGPDPAVMLATIERERVTKLFCPPTVWIGLLRHPRFDHTDLSSLAKGYYGASIMPVEIIKELSARIPQLRLFNFYGQTELSPVATVLQPEDQLRKLGSAGRPAINVQTCIVDDEDRPVPPGTVGEIVHRSPQVMVGYWNDPERTAEAFSNGWFHSGDLGVMDDEGFLTVVDRKKDMIKTGGENVASREIEEMIFTHPAVSEVAVFGIAHPHWIEAVTAVVVLRAGCSLLPEDLLAFCRERLAGYKTPKRVEIVEQLPKNASGKILKRELRQRFADRAADPEPPGSAA